jgi:endonuclease YncB( thermonuclease family)
VDRENSLGEPIGTATFELAYRVRIIALTVFAALLTFALLAPEPELVSPAADSGADRNEDKGRNFEEVRGGVRDITPPAVHRPPPLKQKLVERLPAIRREEPKQKPKLDEWIRPQILGAGILESQGKRIVIAGVDPLVPGSICRKSAEPAWPCGNLARTAMRRLIRLRTIACNPVEDAGDNSELVTRCEISGYDIGAWLVSQGWATALAGSGYEPMESEAREAGVDSGRAWGRR